MVVIDVEALVVTTIKLVEWMGVGLGSRNWEDMKKISFLCWEFLMTDWLLMVVVTDDC